MSSLGMDHLDPSGPVGWIWMTSLQCVPFARIILPKHTHLTQAEFVFSETCLPSCSHVCFASMCHNGVSQSGQLSRCLKQTLSPGWMVCLFFPVACRCVASQSSKGLFLLVSVVLRPTTKEMLLIVFPESGHRNMIPSPSFRKHNSRIVSKGVDRERIPRSIE